MEKKAIEVFNGWAQKGRDEGMKKNHFESYVQIKKIIKEEFQGAKNAFLADVGCGNGWATEDLLKESFITKAYGYDGAKEMIKNAQKKNHKTNFFHTNLNRWNPKQKFDIIYSMEVLYYLKEPQSFIQECYKKWLKPNGLFIAGIDYYKENKKSHSWPEQLGVSMKIKTCDGWKRELIKSKFNNCKIKIVNKKKDWAGTLIFWGRKNDL